MEELAVCVVQGVERNRPPVLERIEPHASSHGKAAHYMNLNSSKDRSLTFKTPKNQDVRILRAWTRQSIYVSLQSQDLTSKGAEAQLYYLEFLSKPERKRGETTYTNSRPRKGNSTLLHMSALICMCVWFALCKMSILPQM